ncbi:hypothetical protein OIU78_017177 [Salix suchowensis]|nr:hypothetical protein OIU78_017177 [Salix suchowensis]
MFFSHLTCAILKISVQQVKFLDYPYLQDGYGSSWDLNLLKDEGFLTCTCYRIRKFLALAILVLPPLKAARESPCPSVFTAVELKMTL